MTDLTIAIAAIVGAAAGGTTGLLMSWAAGMYDRRPPVVLPANYGSRNSKLPPPKWEDMNPPSGKHDPAYQILNLTQRVQRLEDAMNPNTTEP